MAPRRDFRKLDPATRAELRRVAAGMVEAGKTRTEAAAAVGVDRRFVGAWVEAARRYGEDALAGGRRGRRPGEREAPSPRQEGRIRRLVGDCCPDQLKPPFALWTREAVGAPIARETGVRLSASALGRILRAWGFAPQRPARRATGRRGPEVRAWLERDYPAIAGRAKAEGAEIHRAGKTGLPNQANHGRSFAPRGETPIPPRPAARVSRSMIPGPTNRGTPRFMIHDGALTAATFLAFLRRLVKGAAGGRKLFVIVDDLRVHRAGAVTTRAGANPERIELFHLPPHAPEHDPDEFPNSDVKQAMARRRVPRDKATPRSGLTSSMRGLQRRPAKARAFFQAATTRCAAEASMLPVWWPA